MGEDTFWALVEGCRRESGDASGLAARLLFRRLRRLEAAEVVAFVQWWERARSRLYCWPVTDALCLLLGVVEEEDLCRVQDWIISYGRAVVERTVRDPDSLVDLATDADRARSEEFGEFLTEAHVLVSGTWPLGYDPEGPDDLGGERTDLGDPAAVQQRFPRLAAFRCKHPDRGAPELR